MPGPIQTAINKLLGMTAAGVAAGKKYASDQGQTIQEEVDKRTQEAIERATIAEEIQEENKTPEVDFKKKQAEIEAIKLEKKEASAVATEADVRNLGGSKLAARAYRLAQERGLADPKRIIFDEKGEAVATYEEMATLLADDSLSGTLSSRLRTKNSIKLRKQLLEGKTHKERVEDALLSIGGK